jgi:hypothetical protein
MGSAVEAEDQDRGSGPEVDPIRALRLGVQDLEGVAKVEVRPIVAQPVREQRQVGKPEGARLVVLGRCPGSAHQQTFGHFAEAVGEPLCVR